MPSTSVFAPVGSCKRRFVQRAKPHPGSSWVSIEKPIPPLASLVLIVVPENVSAIPALPAGDGATGMFAAALTETDDAGTEVDAGLLDGVFVDLLNGDLMTG